MDIQIKKGLLDVCVLRALTKEESYGYKIIQDLAPYVDISESTLYPVLKRLESAAHVTTWTKEQNGRLRRYYMITQAGTDHLMDFRKNSHSILKIIDYITNGGLRA
ncbi:MAG: PadR family transcriptional regulator [Firmicutes bacterium]|nr:PadR family transcriptional regulator [Bacillota bacterium]